MAKPRGSAGDDGVDPGPGVGDAGNGVPSRRDPEDVSGYPFSVRLRLLANQLTAAEAKVGEYFAQHPESVYRSITEVVELSSLSYGSIIRFCQKLGCSGFQEFKVLLAQELGAARSTPPEDEPVRRVLERAVGDVRSTELTIDRGVLGEIAAAICAAGHVLIGAVASSAPSALSLDWKLTRLGVRAHHECEGYVLGVRASLLGPGDLFIAISSSGSTKDVIAAAERARAHKALVVAITNFPRTPLGELAHLRVHSAAARDPIAAEIPSIIATEYVIDVIVEHVRVIKPGASEAIGRSFAAIADRKL